MHTKGSVVRTGRCTCLLLALGDAGRSVGRVFCCDRAVATTALRSEESALIPSPSPKLGRRVPKAG